VAGKCGGKSAFFERPVWQKGPGVPSGTNRLVPDVSLTADPTEGAFVFLNGQVQQFGGTSWSAPVWAGFCALINEARTNANKPPLPFLNPLIYPLIGTSCFRDIVAGSNGAFDAGAGYDMVTGVGVPNVKELIQALTR
jgi:kumamolisin